MPYVEIPWHFFLKEEDRLALEKEDEKPLEVVALTHQFHEDRAQIERWESITPQLSDLIKQKSFYLDGTMNREGFNLPIETIANITNKEELSKALFDLLGDVYKKEHREVHSLTFVTYERIQEEKGEKERIHLSLNTVGDEAMIYAQPVIVEIDSGGAIVAITSENESEQTNTPTPLTTQAFLDESTEDLAMTFIQKLEGYMEDATYEVDPGKATSDILKNIEKEEQTLHFKVEESLLNNIGIWVHHAKGQYKAKVIAVSYSDKEAEPLTTYTIAVPNTESIQTFHLIVDRSENRIIKLTKEETK